MFYVEEKNGTYRITPETAKPDWSWAQLSGPHGTEKEAERVRDRLIAQRNNRQLDAEQFETYKDAWELGK